MRNIDLDKPLTPEDREFLRQWSRQSEIYDNDLRFGNLSDDEKATVAGRVEADRETDRKRLTENGEEPAEFDADLIELVESLDTVELRKALDKAGLESDGEREKLEEIYLNHLQDAREAEES